MYSAPEELENSENVCAKNVIKPVVHLFIFLVAVLLYSQSIEHQLWSIVYINHFFSFSMLPYSYRNTSGCLGGWEIEVGTPANRESVFTLFWVYIHHMSVSIMYGSTGKNVFYFLYKINCRKQVLYISGLLMLCVNAISYNWHQIAPIADR